MLPENPKPGDIVFDIYLDHSIKNSTKNNRGFGKRIKVARDTPIPRHWKSFLRVNEVKELVATKNIVIVTNIANYLPSQLTPCNHEEVNTRILPL